MNKLFIIIIFFASVCIFAESNIPSSANNIEWFHTILSGFFGAVFASIVSFSLVLLKIKHEKTIDRKEKLEEIKIIITTISISIKQTETYINNNEYSFQFLDLISNRIIDNYIKFNVITSLHFNDAFKSESSSLYEYSLIKFPLIINRIKKEHNNQKSDSKGNYIPVISPIFIQEMNVINPLLNTIIKKIKGNFEARKQFFS